MSWYWFGGLRGLIGGLITFVVALSKIQPWLCGGVCSFAWKSVTTNVGGLTQTNLTAIYSAPIPVPDEIILVALVVFQLLCFIFYGFQYWVGANVLRILDLNVTGLVKAITVGLVGGFIIFLPLLWICNQIFEALPIPLVIDLPQVLITTLLIEVVMAIVTWYLLKALGVKLPS